MRHEAVYALVKSYRNAGGSTEKGNECPLRGAIISPLSAPTGTAGGFTDVRVCG